MTEREIEAVLREVTDEEATGPPYAHPAHPPPKSVLH